MSVPPVAMGGGAILFDKYILHGVLGHGSFGKVYKASRVSDGSVVAIKALHKCHISSPEAEEGVLREVTAMSRLNHPNIVRLHEVMATKSKIYLVMDLARCGDLMSSILRRGFLYERAARRYFQQLVSAVQYCHARGITHRDIKPENILLDDGGRTLKVSDFGLSALPENRKGGGLLSTTCGTKAYMAPEVLCRKAYDGAKADAWSCGVVLFVLVTGRHPFHTRNVVAMYRSACKREFTLPEGLSDGVQRVLNQLLDPNPETRVTVSQVMETSWFRKDFTPSLGHEELDKVAAVESVAKPMNAFDIITMSSGLDLSGLFEEEKRVVRRFMTAETAEKVVGKVEVEGRKLGYVVKKRKGGFLFGLSKEEVEVVVVEVLQMVELSLVMVVLKAESGGDAVVDDIVSALHNAEKEF